jgi:hypothetical protein
METNQQNLDSFDENQSFKVIQEMIQVSQKKLKNNGVLFILWGWVAFYGSITGYIARENALTYQVHRFLSYSGTVLGILAIVYTIYIIWTQRKKVQTYIGITLRYVWGSMVVCMVLINLIQFNVFHNISFELQHPIYMVIFAFATVISGSLLRYRLIILGGIVFGFLALLSSYFPLPKQLLFEAIAWLIAFVIPGHYLYAKRNN